MPYFIIDVITCIYPCRIISFASSIDGMLVEKIIFASSEQCAMNGQLSNDRFEKLQEF
jgi:hypothetical protein